MIKRAAIYVLGAVLGVVLGAVSALYMAGLWPGMKPLDFGDVAIDLWRSDFALGSEAADPYTRARVARHGLLALAKSEAVYFTRTTDGAGEALSEDCTYRLTFYRLPASWWSITLYNEESMLPSNEDGALSVNADQDGAAIPIVNEGSPIGVDMIVSAKRPDSQNLWISSRNAGKFDLTLRLYEPKLDWFEDPDAMPPDLGLFYSMPSVSRISCEGDTP